jgi:hypothetical protein
LEYIFNLTYDLPIEYKGIKIYPVTVKDYLLFNVYAQCLSLDKNSIPDIKIISMSELEYIYYSTQNNAEEQPYLLWFDRLLSLCLKDEKSFEKLEESIQRYYMGERDKPFFKIGNEVFDSYDYTKIKEIIAEQNMVELPDFSISKEVRDSLEEARRYKARESKPVSFEDYLVSLSIATGWKLEDIYTMTIRKFTKSIRRMDNLIHYKIYLAASMSGMVEFKDKSFIKHWLSNLEENNNFGDVTMDLDSVQGKMSLESAKE